MPWSAKRCTTSCPIGSDGSSTSRWGLRWPNSSAADLEAHLAELAHHYWQAAHPGHATQVLAYARRAGDKAMTILAYERAAAHYERAVQALDLQGSADLSTPLRVAACLGRRPDGRW